MVAEIVVMVTCVAWMVIIIIILIWHFQSLERMQKKSEDRIIRHINFSFTKYFIYGQGQTKKTEKGEANSKAGTGTSESIDPG